jgi:membrane-associated protease RseP (regulator of RpoE activity)
MPSKATFHRPGRNKIYISMGVRFFPSHTRESQFGGYFMFGKALSFAAAAFILAPVVTGQTPKAPAPGEPRTFSFSWDGDGGYLGVQTEEVTRENLGKYNLREVRGVAVAKVVEGSPAAAAGLQDGDVIVKINGEDITSGRKLTRLVSEISPDHTAQLTVVRGGSEREINVTVGKRPMPTFAEGSFFPEGLKDFDLKMPELEKFEFKMPELEKLKDLEKFKWESRPGEPMVWSFSNRRQIGVGLTPLTKQLSDHFGVTNGALINNVREDSPAAKAGLKAGDVITEIDGKAVKGELDVVRAIGEKKEGEVTVTFVRAGQKQTVRVTPQEGKGNFFEHFESDGDLPTPKPGEPGVFKMQRPGTPSTLLNHMIAPARVV